MNRNYKFCVIRYIHDQMNAEFVNVGVISVFDGKIRVQFADCNSRLAAFFRASFDANHFSTLKKAFTVAIESRGSQILADQPNADPYEIWCEIFQDDVGFAFRPGLVAAGVPISSSPKSAEDQFQERLDGLFLDFIMKHV